MKLGINLVQIHWSTPGSPMYQALEFQVAAKLSFASPSALCITFLDYMHKTTIKTLIFIISKPIIEITLYQIMIAHPQAQLLKIPSTPHKSHNIARKSNIKVEEESMCVIQALEKSHMLDGWKHRLWSWASFALHAIIAIRKCC